MGVNMRLWEYNTVELLEAAQWAHWCNDDRFAKYLMEEIAERIMEEHPPNEQKLESEIEESAEEAEASHVHEG
jgi:hypothetical protein